MENNERKTNYSIKSKLVSAIAMLLVATIMVVSSTYAWFTLSTAPEVTGISTAVGANGALEMLLATKKDGEWFYGTGSLAGETDMTERNTYWGNLVDLSDNTLYGTNLISLYPSKLVDLQTLPTNAGPLSVPEYGADGRVKGFATAGYGKYDNNSFVDATDHYGFRAVGVASGLTERQQAFRSAVSAMATAQNSARNRARQSLDDKGDMLANIAVIKAFDDNATYEEKHLTAIKDMITGLEDALKEAEKAYVEAVVAFVLSSNNSADDAAAISIASYVRTQVDSVAEAELGEKIEAALDAVENYPSLPSGVTLDLGQVRTSAEAALLGYEGVFVEKVVDPEKGTKYCAVDQVATAKSKANNLSGGTYTWNQIKEALLPIVDMDKIQINGIPAVDVSGKKNELVQTAMQSGVTVKIATGGGVYADIADLSGNYRVDIIVDLRPASLEMDLDATMVTESTKTTPDFTAISTALKTKEPASSGAAKLPLTEFYGYVIDLAFRTNAAESNLLLQTDAIDRIYTGNNNSETMGGGSNMTFSTANGFTADKAKALASHFRVVFFDTDNGTVYATAKLDTANATVDAEGNIVANLYLFENATATKYVKDTTTYYKVDNTFYSGLPCSDSTKLTTAPNVEEFDESSVEVEVRDNVITSLGQNTAKRVSALVYLDGETIQNSDVAATAAESLTGTLNLQFASSAELVPMEYGTLHTVNNNQNAGN